MIMNNKLESMWKKSVVTFKVLLHYVSGGIEENYENSQSG